MLPPRGVPIKSCEFSIVDGVGFTPDYHRDHVVRDDPRDATAAMGREWRRQSIEELAAAIERLAGAGVTPIAFELGGSDDAPAALRPLDRLDV